MLIDWFTFIAQLINFLVLFWLLKRFLFKPIMNAVDEREKRIALQIQDAETLKKAATEELDNFQLKNKEFDQQRQDLLNNAVSEVDSERQRLLEQTRNDIEELRLQLQETIKKEQQKLGSEIINRTRTEVFSIARKTLADLASVDLEDQMAEVFIKRIKKLDSKEKELLLSAINKVRGEVILRSAFELPSNHKTALVNMLKKDFFSDAKIRFETSLNLVSGIELIAGGYKVVWSIDDYLVSLEEDIAALLSANSLSDYKA
jgi:F-type H+-transporting ATPase subunit b